MAFTLYAAGTTNKESTAFKRSISYPQLLSQYLEKKNVLDWVEYLKTHPECHSKLFIDSGAFTAHTKGIDIPVDSYIEFLNEIDDYTYIFAQMDKIAGVRGKKPTDEERAEAPKLSWENYLYMVERVKSPKKLIPVFHQGDDFFYLKQMVEYKYKDGTPIWYIGISPNKELHVNDWKKWLEKVFKVIKESSNPNVCTHAFGCTSLPLLEQYPFTSADSTTWLKVAAFGCIIVDGKTVYVSSRNKLSPDYLLNQPKAVIEAVEKRCKDLGFTLEEVMNDEEQSYIRHVFNLSSLNDWAKNYVYRGSNHFKEELW